MDSYINKTCFIYNKTGFTTGIVFRIQEYLLFSYNINNKNNINSLNIILPSGILNWNYVAEYLIDQLNEYNIKYELNILFSYELQNNNLRIKAKFDYKLYNNNTFIKIQTSYKPINNEITKSFTTLKTNNTALFILNNDLNDFFLYYDFPISNEYNFNDLYILTTYHNIDISTINQKVICKYISDNNNINEKILDFTIIGYDIPSDICVSIYSNIDSSFSINNVLSFNFNWTKENQWFLYSATPFIIDNSKNSKSSFMYNPQIIPNGTDIFVIGNSIYDNNSINYGILSDNSFTGFYGEKPIVESLLLNCSAYNGYSGGPVLTNMITEWDINTMLTNIIDFCQSSMGSIIYVITYIDNKYIINKSFDYGHNFIKLNTSYEGIDFLNENTNDTSIIKISVDSTGIYVFISISDSGIILSYNGGESWIIISTDTGFKSIESSYDGSFFISTKEDETIIYCSFDYGNTILAIPEQPKGLDIIKIGDKKIIAIHKIGYLYVSDIQTINFTSKINDRPRLWSAIDIKNGIICATTQKGEVFISNDNGEIFTKVTSLPILNFTSVSIDLTGKNIILSCNSFIEGLINNTFLYSYDNVITDNLKENNSYIYISNNYGKSWYKDYSTDLKYKFDKLLISSDYKYIIGVGYYDKKRYTDFNSSFLNTQINNNNYKIIGMLVSGVGNEYYENMSIALSNNIIIPIIMNIYSTYIRLNINIKNDINLYSKYIIAGFAKVYMGLQYKHFTHTNLLLNSSLINIFNINKIMGGLWINNFIKGFNFISKKFIYDILEKEKKDSIMFQNPFMNSKIWTIFHKDLSSKYPILLTKIIYFNYWIRDNVLLELGKYNTSNTKTQYDYYDVNLNKFSSIKFAKSDYFTSQRSISDIIYFFYADSYSEDSFSMATIEDFVIEYIYFDIKKQIWNIAAEKVKIFIRDDGSSSIQYPVLLYGYENPSTLFEFSGK
jgi:hypothetical protein